MQLTHDAHTASTQAKELVVLCDGITSPANQGALFRLADAFGVKELIFVGATPEMSSSRLKKTARSTQDHITYSHTQDGQSIIQDLKTNGFTAIALEITKDSIPMATIEPSYSKILLIIGNEQSGITQELLDLAAVTTHIPMYGKNSSMNVAQATAIALHQLSV